MNSEDNLHQPLLTRRESDKSTYRSMKNADGSIATDSETRASSSTSSALARRRVLSDASSVEDYVSIELPSLGPIGDNNALAIALHKCKKYVLQLYLFLLKVLGWLPWMSDEAVPRCGEAFTWVFNIVYPIIVIAILVLGYILQFASCLSRSRPYYEAIGRNHSAMNCSDRDQDLDVCVNPISTYFWPDVMHALSYSYAFYVFRWCKNEELETVMTKTFLQTMNSRHIGYLSRGVLTRKLRLILMVGIAWVLLQFVTNILVIVARILDCQVTGQGRIGFSSWIAAGDELTVPQMYVLLVFMLIGFLGMDMVYVAVAANYGAQCELLIFLIRGLNERIEEKSISLQQAMRDYHNAGNYIDSLGKQLAIAMSLIEVIFIAQAVVAFVSLYDVKDSATSGTTEILFFIAGVSYVLLWSAVAIFALIQASRLNSACSATVQVSLDVRLFGYQDATQSDIDSFIVYMTSHGQQRAARLFRLPIYSSHLWGLVAAVFTVLLILSSLGVLKFSLRL
ncbi:uncharacterized protein LOC134196613 [Corticium candelabrum]|uniref:uncharacterized protein LOC134196613 n=1 Tax=Corticium candelabrum TaxID=121492 RepID=UPI002E273522|nr:uncharacterized protein LOC134196613 [Corticium candelabrum]XP_062521789.1 uncharacterized protein LOC134196613 [Corticium candelabrum]